MDTQSECGVVFLQDKLNMDHFTRFADVYSPNSNGGSFKNIRDLIDNNYSAELPQVENPHVAVEKLKDSFSGDVHSVKSVEELERLDLSEGKKVLLMVHLSPLSGQKDVENAIQENDATVGDITRHLQKRNIKYSALFTGQSSADDKAASVEAHSNRRLLASDSSSNGTFMNVSGQMYVFMKEAYLVVAVGGRTLDMNLTLTPEVADTSILGNTSAEIRYVFNNTMHNGSTYDVTIVTSVENWKDRWVMKRISLFVEGGTAPHSNVSLNNATLSHEGMDLAIPILYSWHCTEMTLPVDTIYQKDLKSLQGTYIRFIGYQLQPFSIQNNRFFDAQDCVPYFTRAIWMFLFSSIFLVSILIFGVRMVLSLSTMDKYDDPKGKTISVAQGTE